MPCLGQRALITSAAVVVLALAGCRRSEKGTPSGAITPAATSEDAAAKNKAFWTWFASHEAEVAAMTSAGEPIGDELRAELSKVRKELTFEVGPKATPRELIVSADGMKGAFPAVLSLVAAAPPLPGWKVIAFRPRKPGLSIEMGDVKLSPAEVKFSSSRESTGTLAVTLFVPGRTPANAKEIDGAALLLLDSVLGEYDVETRIGEIAIKPIDEVGKREVRPLADLAAVVDATKKR